MPELRSGVRRRCRAPVDKEEEIPLPATEKRSENLVGNYIKTRKSIAAAAEAEVGKVKSRKSIAVAAEVVKVKTRKSIEAAVAVVVKVLKQLTRWARKQELAVHEEAAPELVIVISEGEQEEKEKGEIFGAAAGKREEGVVVKRGDFIMADASGGLSAYRVTCQEEEGNAAPFP